MDYGSDDEEDPDRPYGDLPLGHLTLHSLSRKRSTPASLAAALRMQGDGVAPDLQQLQIQAGTGGRKMGTAQPTVGFQIGDDNTRDPFDSLFHDKQPPSPYGGVGVLDNTQTTYGGMGLNKPMMGSGMADPLHNPPVAKHNIINQKYFLNWTFHYIFSHIVTASRSQFHRGSRG